jgi:hypothetical protein
MDPKHHATALQRGSAARPAAQPDDASRRSEAAPVELDYQAAWRHTLVTVKEALADLEAAANRTPVEPMMAVSSLVERLVAVATAAADAAGQHIRAEARAEVAQTQALVAQVQAELQRERDQLKAVSQTLDTERVARARAEAALEEARDASERSASAYEAQLRSLSAELEANRAEFEASRAQAETNRAQVDANRAELETHRAELETRRAEIETRRAEIAHLRQQVEAERAERAALIAAIKQAITAGEAGGDARGLTTYPTTELEADRSGAATSAPIDVPASPAPPSDDNVRQAPPQNPELAAYARELLGRAETMYRADVAARRSTSELIDRLTSSLRRARLAFARRMGATDLKHTTIFEQQLAEVLDTSEETTFSRHLGIAAYESLSKPGL